MLFIIGILFGTALVLGSGNICTFLKLRQTRRECLRLTERVESLSCTTIEYSEEIDKLKEFVRSRNLLEAAKVEEVIPRKSDVDELIDSIEQMEVTGIRHGSHSEEYDKNFIGTKPLVTLEFSKGTIKLIDLAQIGDSRGWLVDLLYKGAPFPRLTVEHRKRLNEIFMNKMAQAAMRDIK